MAETEQKKKATMAVEVIETYEAPEAVTTLVKDVTTAEGLVKELSAKSMLVEALEFTAHALPRVRAVWWGASCFRTVAEAAKLSDEDAKLLEHVERWCVEPTDARRRVTWAAAQAMKKKTLPHSLAMAAFFAGDSIAELDSSSIVPPPPGTTAKMVTVALKAGAAVGAAGADPKPLLESFLGLGQDLGETADRWKGVALALVEEHRPKAQEEEEEPTRLLIAAKELSVKSPAELDDERLGQEMERVYGPIREKAEAQAAEAEEAQKKAEEAKKKAEEDQKKALEGADPNASLG